MCLFIEQLQLSAGTYTSQRRESSLELERITGDVSLLIGVLGSTWVLWKSSLL